MIFAVRAKSGIEPTFEVRLVRSRISDDRRYDFDVKIDESRIVALEMGLGDLDFFLILFQL